MADLSAAAPAARHAMAAAARRMALAAEIYMRVPLPFPLP
jgi:hypothetical protein